MVELSGNTIFSYWKYDAISSGTEKQFAYSKETVG